MSSTDCKQAWSLQDMLVINEVEHIWSKHRQEGIEEPSGHRVLMSTQNWPPTADTHSGSKHLPETGRQALDTQEGL